MMLAHLDLQIVWLDVPVVHRVALMKRVVQCCLPRELQMGQLIQQHLNLIMQGSRLVMDGVNQEFK
jgi:hypothetical protein